MTRWVVRVEEKTEEGRKQRKGRNKKGDKEKLIGNEENGKGERRLQKCNAETGESKSRCRTDQIMMGKEREETLNIRLGMVTRDIVQDGDNTARRFLIQAYICIFL